MISIRHAFMWLFSALCVFVSIKESAAAVIYVDIDADGQHNGTSWLDAYTNLQDALLVAQEGDEIWVAEGAYSPTVLNGDRNKSFELVNGVVLYGGFNGTEVDADQRDPVLHTTLLSGDLNGDDTPDGGNNTENSYHVVEAFGSDNTTVLDGFTVSNGHSDANEFDTGAGIYIYYASPVVNQCIITANLGRAAVHNLGGAPVLTDCALNKNMAAGVSNVLQGIISLYYCDLRDNDSLAISSHGSTLIVVGCAIINNGLGGSVLPAGGIDSFRDVEATLINCLFQGNKASEAGGLAASGDATTVINCAFIGNSGGEGSGSFLNDGFATFHNCTFYTDWLKFGTATVTIRNSLHWGVGTGTEEEQIRDDIFGRGELIINNSTVQGWTGKWGGVGNNGLDPLFVDPDGPDDIPGTEDDDLRLSPGSPAIDSGNNLAVPDDEFDLDGDGDTTEPVPFDLDGLPRFVNDPATKDPPIGNPPFVDRGAYEFQVAPPPCEGDANADGAVDPLDAGYVLARFNCPVNTGDPACDAADVNADFVVDPLDVGFVLSRFGDCM